MTRLDCIRRPIACFAAALALCLGAPLTSAAAEIGPAPIAELGAAAAEALETLLPQLGGSGGLAPLPPQLEDLASSTVAVNAWAAGDLIGAWTAVEGKLSPVSMSLREQVLQVARQTSVPAPMRARVLAASGDVASAWSLIRRDAPGALASEEPDPALAERLAELHSDPSRAAEHWIEAGRRSARRLDPQRARSQLERAASLAPDTTARVSLELGALEARLGRPAEALVAYRRARNGGVGPPAVLTAIGRAHRELGATAESERALRSALEVAPDDDAAQGELGVLYADAERYSEAVELLRAAHGQDPRNPVVRRGWAPRSAPDCNTPTSVGSSTATSRRRISSSRWITP